MNTNRDKDLNELLGKLLGADEAAQCAEDIRRGDELLARNPVPAPRPELLADIKSQMLLAHYRKRRSRRLHHIYAPVAVAACLALIFGLVLFFMSGNGASDQLMTNHNFAGMDEANQNIVTYTSELNQLDDSATAIMAVDFDATPAGYQSTVAAFEASLWKG